MSTFDPHSGRKTFAPSMFDDLQDAAPEPATPPPIDGETYDPEQDGERLRGQLQRVFNQMSDGAWWTLEHLTLLVGGTEAAVSARIRDLRKPKFGGYRVDRRRVQGANGIWEYRLAGAGRPGDHA
jgi:hypothetical protein